MSWVIIIPKEGWGWTSILFLVWHQLFRFFSSFFFFSFFLFSFFFFIFFSFFFEKSVSYQKKDERGHARPYFFWYDNDSRHKGPFRNAFKWSEVKVTWVKVKVMRVRGIGQGQPGNSSQGQGHMSRLQDQAQKLYVEVSAWLEGWNMTIFIMKMGFLSEFGYIFCTRNAQ